MEQIVRGFAKKPVLSTVKKLYRAAERIDAKCNATLPCEERVREDLRHAKRALMAMARQQEEMGRTYPRLDMSFLKETTSATVWKTIHPVDRSGITGLIVVLGMLGGGIGGGLIGASYGVLLGLLGCLFCIAGVVGLIVWATCTKRQWFPRFAVFGVFDSHSRCIVNEIVDRGRYMNRINPGYKVLSPWSSEFIPEGIDSQVMYETEFTGTIPDAVRENAKVLKDKVFDDVYMIQEATAHDWKTKQTPRPDPLLVGRINKTFWLLEAFDLTPVEKDAVDLAGMVEL